MEEQTQHRTTTSTRLRLVLGENVRDFALPAEVPLADLLPAVLMQFGADAIERGSEHEGWIVQRVGEKPLDEDRTLAELNVYDGESLHLRPRSAQLAAIDYDDLVDGIGEQVREHPGVLTPARSRWLFRTGGGIALLTGTWCLLAGTASAAQAEIAVGFAFLLLAGSALVARGAAKPVVATVLAGAGALQAALAGAVLVTVLDQAASPMVQVTGAAAGALLALVAGLLIVADAAQLFTGAIVFILVLLITGLIGALSPATPPEAAAIGLVVSLIIGLFVPHTAFRLSGLNLPMLPGGADELHEDIEPVPHEIVADRGVLIFGYSTALHVGLGLAQALLLPILAGAGDEWSMALSLVMALLLLLRSRHPAGLVQKSFVLVPAAVAIAVNAMRVSAEQPAAVRLFLVVPLIMVAGLLVLLAGEQLPGRRLRPYWGRVVEIFESITAIAVLPILLQVLQVYTFMRALAG
ncbi:type VII secretion integral membrane protein EccD [Amycolatopsis pigmentata]|uniref:Type VII secretion integral membrane protein EccD n=1 Tax=Amycolatopsis pigmentata TaxID=450801 RepID=A0ABW5FZN6_9PSEU